MPRSIATPPSPIIASASSARSGTILTRPMTACMSPPSQLWSLGPPWRPSRCWSIGELTYLSLVPLALVSLALVSPGPPRHERRGLSPPAQAELGEDARHVVLDRLAREEEAFGDLGVRQPFAQEGQHFLLTLGEPPDVLRPGPRRFHAEVPHQRGGGVRVAAGSQILEDRQCSSRLGPGHLTLAVSEHPREQQPRLRGAVGNPGLDELRERRYP